MTTRSYKPIFRDDLLGELALVPDGGLLNIGGTSSPTFTVGGRALLFADGSSTAPDSGTGTTLQAAYSNSTSPATIALTNGKDIIFSALGGAELVFSANTGAVRIDGDLTLNGLINGVSLETLIDHINSLTSPAKHTAAQVSVDDTALTVVAGTTVQEVIESIDSQLVTLNVGNVVGFEYVQVAPATSWTVVHGSASTKVQVQVWDETNSMVLPDTVTIVDGDTVSITFSTPQAGRAILMAF